MKDCPFCKTTGKCADGYNCLHCIDGDRESQRLLTAYRFGLEDAIDAFRRMVGFLRQGDLPSVGTASLRARLAADESHFAEETEDKLSREVVDSDSDV